LDVDHVPRAKILLIASHKFGEFKQALIGLPGRARVILKIETVLMKYVIALAKPRLPLNYIRASQLVEEARLLNLSCVDTFVYLRFTIYYSPAERRSLLLKCP